MKKHTLLIAAILAIPALVWGSAACADTTVSDQSEAAAVVAAVTPSAGAEVTTTDAEVPAVGTIAVKNLVGKKLGVPQGTVQDIYLMETYPQLELQRHNFEADMMLALEKGICDAAIMDDVICYALARKKPGIKLFEDPSLPKNFMGMAFNHTPEGKELCKQFNAFLSKLRESGELEAICNKWIVNTETAEMPKLNIPTEGEPIIVGMEPCTEPIVFMRGEDIVGMDAELIYRFAEYIGRPIEIKNIDYYGLLTAVAAGQVDIASSGFLITAERGESVLFSDPYYTSRSIIATRSDSAPVVAEEVELPSVGTIAVKDLVGKKLGVPQGTVQDIYLMETYPQLELQRHNFEADMMLALEKGICDAAIMDDVICYALSRKKPNIQLFEDPSLPKNFMGMAFNHTDKGKELCKQFNAFLSKLRESGELEAICNKWIVNTETAEMPKFNIPTEGKPIIVGMEPCTEPIVFMRGEEIVGMDAELIYRFAEHVGRPVEIKNIDYYGLLTAVAAGQVDIASSGFLITAERGESVLFSDPYYTSRSIIATRSEGATAATGESDLPALGTIAVKDLVGKKLGVPQGTVQDIYLMETYPQLELQRHNFEADMMLALEKGICDAAIMDDVICYALSRKKPNILLFEDPSLPKNFMGMAFNHTDKGKELCKQFNEFLSKLRESGELEAICDKWIRHTETAQMPELNIPTEGEPIIVGMEPCTEPIVFMRGEDIVGMDAELIYRFAEYVGRPVEIKNIDYYGLLTAVAAGQVDIASSGFLITAERGESVLFSDPYYTSISVIATRKDINLKGEPSAVTKAAQGILGSISDSFYRNIIAEKRYMLIWDGLKATFAIAFFSTLFGTVVGAAVCYLRMSRSKFWQWFARVYIDIMRGTPILILLMLMYYVAFAGTQVEALYVAIITFSLNFGAYVSEMFRSSITSIDRGQTEAGIAMGFSPFHSFYYIVLPQAIKRVLPVYKGEVISLIKNTSVVGYIAIADLTKMTDIIRARTFDPFFPLLMVAILYFLIAWLFTFILDRASRNIR